MVGVNVVVNEAYIGNPVTTFPKPIGAENIIHLIGKQLTSRVYNTSVN